MCFFRKIPTDFIEDVEKSKMVEKNNGDDVCTVKPCHDEVKFLHLGNCRLLLSLDASLISSDVVIDVTEGIIVSVSAVKRDDKSYEGKMEVMDCKN